MDTPGGSGRRGRALHPPRGAHTHQAVALPKGLFLLTATHVHRASSQSPAWALPWGLTRQPSQGRPGWLRGPRGLLPLVGRLVAKCSTWASEGEGRKMLRGAAEERRRKAAGALHRSPGAVLAGRGSPSREARSRGGHPSSPQRTPG